MDNQGPAYQVKVQGKIGKDWSDWFAGLTVTQADDEKPFIPTLKADINEQRKHTDAGERNGKMVLADFLEE